MFHRNVPNLKHAMWYTTLLNQNLLINMKKNLKLKDLKVSSFVTEINKSDKKTVQGGAKSLLCLTGMYPTLPVNNCIG